MTEGNALGKALVAGGLGVLRRARRLQFLALDWQQLDDAKRARIRGIAPELAQLLDENLADQADR